MMVMSIPLPLAFPYHRVIDSDLCSLLTMNPHSMRTIAARIFGITKSTRQLHNTKEKGHQSWYQIWWQWIGEGWEMTTSVCVEVLILVTDINKYLQGSSCYLQSWQESRWLVCSRWSVRTSQSLDRHLREEDKWLRNWPVHVWQCTQLPKASSQCGVCLEDA